MPIYEYECKVCRQRFEKLQSINDEPIRVCPNCGEETRRVLQPVGVIFKGSGWYSTDSRKSTSASTTDKNNSATSTNSTNSTPATGDSGTTDTPAKESAPTPTAPSSNSDN